VPAHHSASRAADLHQSVSQPGCRSAVSPGRCHCFPPGQRLWARRREFPGAVLTSAPIRATAVKRAYGSGPVTTRAYHTGIRKVNGTVVWREHPELGVWEAVAALLTEFEKRLDREAMGSTEKSIDAQSGHARAHARARCPTCPPQPRRP
jgi:hypothetical protein